MKKKITIFLFFLSVSINVIFFLNLFKTTSVSSLEVGTFQTSTFYIDESIAPLYTIVLKDNEFMLYSGDNKIKENGNYTIDDDYIYVSIDDKQIVGYINSNKEFHFPMQYGDNVFVLAFNKVSEYPLYID